MSEQIAAVPRVSTTPRPTPAPRVQLWLYRVYMSAADKEGFYVYADSDETVAIVVADRAISLGLGSVTPRHERFPKTIDPKEVSNEQPQHAYAMEGRQ